MNSSKYGNSQRYLAAKIKRERPDIAAAVERGEYKSMRAAAIRRNLRRAKWRYYQPEMLQRLRRLIRRARGKKSPPDLPVPKFAAIDPPRSGKRYLIGAAIVIAGACSWFFLRPAPSVQPIVHDQPSPDNATRKQPGCCEWVNSTTRADGTHVEGYWRTKPGCAVECSLATKHKEPVVSEKPPVEVGPRGGCYHYSRTGKKVYQPCPK